MEGIARLHWAVQVVTPADKNERENKPCQTAEKDGWVGMEHHIGSVGRVRSKKPLTEPATDRDHQRAQNDDYIAQNPKRANAQVLARGVRAGLSRNVTWPQFFLAVGRQAF